MKGKQFESKMQGATEPPSKTKASEREKCGGV